MVDCLKSISTDPHSRIALNPIESIGDHFE
jgi:hypothetical protein